jgi:hypothetical protein
VVGRLSVVNYSMPTEAPEAIQRTGEVMAMQAAHRDQLRDYPELGDHLRERCQDLLFEHMRPMISDGRAYVVQVGPVEYDPGNEFAQWVTLDDGEEVYLNQGVFKVRALVALANLQDCAVGEFTTQAPSQMMREWRPSRVSLGGDIRVTAWERLG